MIDVHVPCPSIIASLVPIKHFRKNSYDPTELKCTVLLMLKLKEPIKNNLSHMPSPSQCRSNQPRCSSKKWVSTYNFVRRPSGTFDIVFLFLGKNTRNNFRMRIIISFYSVVRKLAGCFVGNQISEILYTPTLIKSWSKFMLKFLDLFYFIFFFYSIPLAQNRIRWILPNGLSDLREALHSPQLLRQANRLWFLWLISNQASEF